MDVARAAANFQLSLGVFLILASVFAGIMLASNFQHSRVAMDTENYMKDSGYDIGSFEYKMTELEYSDYYMNVQLHGLNLILNSLIGSFLVTLFGIFFLTQGIINSHDYANSVTIKYIDSFAILIGGSAIITWLIMLLSLIS